MNGQMSNYDSYMKNTYSPVDLNSLPYFVDMKGLKEYAKEKGVKISSLTASEKEQFLKQNLLSKKASNL